jgi:hypothetical protein
MAKKKVEYPTVRAVDGDRERQAFCNPVVNYRYEIRTSSRCSGMKSRATYKTPEGALTAGDRALQNIVNNINARKK